MSAARVSQLDAADEGGSFNQALRLLCTINGIDTTGDKTAPPRLIEQSGAPLVETLDVTPHPLSGASVSKEQLTSKWNMDLPVFSLSLTFLTSACVHLGCSNVPTNCRASAPEKREFKVMIREYSLRARARAHDADMAVQVSHATRPLASCSYLPRLVPARDMARLPTLAL